MIVGAPLLQLSGHVACVLWGGLVIWIFARTTVIRLPQDDPWDTSLRSRLQSLALAVIGGLFLIVFGVTIPTARLMSSAVGIFLAYSGPFAAVATILWTRMSIIELWVAYHLRRRQGTLRAVDTDLSHPTSS